MYIPNIQTEIDKPSKYSLFYNGLVVYPLFGFFIVLYILGKGLSEDYLQDSSSIEFDNHSGYTWLGGSDISRPSIPDINRTYYVNSEGFTERISIIKRAGEDNSKILSMVPTDVNFNKEDSLSSTPVTELSLTRPSTASTDLTRPGTSYTTDTSISNGLNSPDLSQDVFTPTTYNALDSEIVRNSNKAENAFFGIVDWA